MNAVSTSFAFCPFNYAVELERPEIAAVRERCTEHAVRETYCPDRFNQRVKSRLERKASADT